MSRVGKLPIEIVSGVSVNVIGLSVEVTGPKGKLQKDFAGDIEISKEENLIKIKPLNDTPLARSMWGTARSIVSSMVKGVSEGFKAELEVNGVGYRAAVKGQFLN